MRMKNWMLQEPVFSLSISFCFCTKLRSCSLNIWVSRCCCFIHVALTNRNHLNFSLSWWIDILFDNIWISFCLISEFLYITMSLTDLKSESEFNFYFHMLRCWWRYRCQMKKAALREMQWESSFYGDGMQSTG